MMMIIAMPVDRERGQTDAFQSASVCRQLPVPLGLGEAPEITALTSWFILCYRFAQQALLGMDTYLSLAEGEPKARYLCLELSEQQSVAELKQLISRQIPGSSLSGKEANCAFLKAHTEDQRRLAIKLANDGGYELALIVIIEAHAIHLELIFNAQLFDAANAERLLSCYQRCWLEIERQANVSINELAMLTRAERQSLLNLQAPPNIDYPKAPLYQLIRAQGKSSAEAIAVRYDQQQLTYAELAKRSLWLAGYLRAEGVKVGDVVAICMPPCTDFLVALLGIWQAGAVYCPLDPTHPEAYMQHMLELAEPKSILLHSSLQNLGALQSRHRLIMDELTWPIATQSLVIDDSQITLDSPAWLFFTSGTTGKPKAVLASHANLAHYIHVAQQTFAFGARDVFISMARYTFSISLFEIVSPLCVGAQLVLTQRHDVLNPARLLELLESVTVLHAGPSLLAALFRHLEAHPELASTLPHLRHVSSGGDSVSASMMEDMKRVFSNAEIFVLYGSTEISCMGTFYPVQRELAQSKSLVGKCFPGVQLRVLDRQMQVQPYGVVGDIWFAGLGLTRGYYRQAELEHGKFVSLEGERFYKIGDIGRLLANGDLEMLGRNDYQIQLRGIRIELIGIENMVRQLALAQQCAVVHKKEQDQEFLVFFLVGPKTADVVAFRRELAVHLPDFMLPQYVIALEKLPLTVNGKLDRNALQELPWQVESGEESHARADNLLGQHLAAAFARALNRKTVGVDQNFFDLGGHSMLAVLLLQELQEQLNIRIPPQVFFEQPTVQQLTRYLNEGLLQQIRPIALSRDQGKPKLFMLAGVQTYRPLAQRLDGHFSPLAVFTIEELSATDANSESMAIDRLAEQYLQQIRAVQATGPYNLLGYSFAGIVAYELAQKLRAAGEEVGLLILIDSMIPEWNQKMTFRWRQLQRIIRRPPGDVLSFVLRRIKEKIKPRFNELNRFKEDPRLGRLEEQRVIIKSIAANKYLARRQDYPDPCLLIVSEDRLRRDPLKSRNCGWSAVASRLKIQSVPADHFKMIEEEPDVSMLARMIVDHYQDRLQEEPRLEGQHKKT